MRPKRRPSAGQTPRPRWWSLPASPARRRSLQRRRAARVGWPHRRGRRAEPIVLGRMSALQPTHPSGTPIRALLPTPPTRSVLQQILHALLLSQHIRVALDAMVQRGCPRQRRLQGALAPGRKETRRALAWLWGGEGRTRRSRLALWHLAFGFAACRRSKGPGHPPPPHHPTTHSYTHKAHLAVLTAFFLERRQLTPHQ